ncbi:MAG: FGGY-family carbohydrate kinase [Pseudomonadota bacterium]
MSRFALGIDIGTSGVRAALLAADRSVVAIGVAALDDEGAGAGGRRDPAVWKAALAAALADLGASADLGAVGAVAVDGTSGTVLALDAQDAPVGAALMYNDAVEDPAVPQAIAAHAPRETAAHGAASALARAIVLQGRLGVVRILHQADWIAELLAGAPLPSDESNALKTGYDPVARRWPEWLDATPMRRALLPKVVAAGTRTGTTCGAFGLPAGAAIVAGVTDGCASFLATGASMPGDGVTALGTTLTIKLLSPRPVFAPEYGVYSHRIGDRWLAGGASNSGGGVLIAHFAPEAVARLSQEIDPSRDSGLDYYPLAKPGERFPISDPVLAPRLAPRPADDALFLHGMLEGIARIETRGYRLLAEHGAPRLARLRSVGGGASNPIWTALRLRLSGAEAAPALSTEACVGVARLALAHLAP